MTPINVDYLKGEGLSQTNFNFFGSDLLEWKFRSSYSLIGFRTLCVCQDCVKKNVQTNCVKNNATQSSAKTKIQFAKVSKEQLFKENKNNLGPKIKYI